MIDPNLVEVDVEKAWIQTVSGGAFHILDPRQHEIHIEDIGHALAMSCRYTGHSRRFYSVAEHSVLGSYVVPAEDALWFLMHDSPEAFVADVSRPLKHFTRVGSAYIPVEEKIMAAIAKKFGLSLPMPVSVKKADDAMLYAEKAQVLPPMQWDSVWAEGPEPADVRIRFWSPEVAKVEFLHRFYELTQQL